MNLNCLNDRQNRRFAAAVLLFPFITQLCFYLWSRMQSLWLRDRIFSWEQAVSSSLLEQGVEERVIAAAFKNRKISRAGEVFLEKIGHNSENSVFLFELPGRFFRNSLIWGLFVFILLFLFLAVTVFLYLRRRDCLYQHAAGILRRFHQGDFDSRLPRGETGSLYYLFDTANELATALKAKSDIQYKSRLFLKDTISDISHQLKTPLAALSMYVEIISGEPENTKVVEKFAARSQASLERMERLIQSLLKIARLDTGSVVFEKEKCQMSDLARDSAEDLLSRAKREKKRLVFDGDSDCAVVCDPIWTREAIGNLIKNALDHTEEGGRIRLSWKQSPAMVRLLVEDDGCGIPPEDIYHIFKRFYRSKNSKDTGGTGLGLPLAKSIIEGQGGILSVESLPGSGSVFTISFLSDL